MEAVTGDYSYSKLNSRNLPIAAMSAMQHGWYLERLITEVIIADVAQGPIYVFKADFSDRF